jgi:alpha-1,6-mannosyltransferase
LRICDVTTLWIDQGEGGVNTYLREKARYFSRRPEVSHTIIVPGAADHCSKLYGSTVHTLRSPRLPWNPAQRVLWRFGEVRRLLKEDSPTVVEVDCAYFLGRVAASALAGRDVPVLGFYHVHLPTFIARPGTARLGSLVSSLAERLAWKYVRYCCRPCDSVIVASQDIEARLRRHGFARLECSPLGVNAELFRPRKNDRVNGTGADENRPTELLHVGRLSHEKNLDVLLRAFCLLRPVESYRLRIVGDGPLRRRLEKQAAGDPRISFLGTRPYGEELAELYAAADIYVSPSPNETFNLSVLEALASGVPVVSVRQGGSAELIAAGAGELAEPSNALDLAAKIETVRSRPGNYGMTRDYAASTYSWERCFDRLLEIYERAAAERGSRPEVRSAAQAVQ